MANMHLSMNNQLFSSSPADCRLVHLPKAGKITTKTKKLPNASKPLLPAKKGLLKKKAFLASTRGFSPQTMVSATSS
jgi:hypothetical protein